MSASVSATLAAVTRPRALRRTRTALGSAGAAVLGVAPHVLHHAGPLAGAALLAGASGTVLFGVLGFVVAIPMLRHLRRRTGSWRVPVGVLALMATVFTLSSLVIGPALTDSDGGDAATPARPGVAQPAPDGHESHHP